MEQERILELLKEHRGRLWSLMADAKIEKANAKHFAYNKSYCMFSAVIFQIENDKK